MGATVFDVANYYLANTKNVTNKKLQKLVFYAYSWHLVLSNDNVEHLSTRLFENKLRHGYMAHHILNCIINTSRIVIKNIYQY